MYSFLHICLLQQSVQQEKFLPIIVAIGGGVIIVLSLLFLLFFVVARYRQNTLHKRQQVREEEFQKQLMQVQIEVQEQTAADLGRELHDDIGQRLSSTKMLMGVAERQMKEVPETLITANQTLGEAIQSLRALTKTLSAEWLNQFDIKENLRNEAKRLNTANDEMSIEVEAGDEEIPLPPEKSVMAYRIVQEAVQNAIKHANATRIGVLIKTENNRIFIEVSDDGKGFDPTLQSNGVGLKNMLHRTKLLNGNIEWLRNNPKGTRVQISLPTKT